MTWKVAVSGSVKYALLQGYSHYCPKDQTLELKCLARFRALNRWSRWWLQWQLLDSWYPFFPGWNSEGMLLPDRCIHTCLSPSLPDTSVCISKEIRDGFLKISNQPTLISHLSFQELTPWWCYRQIVVQLRSRCAPYPHPVATMGPFGCVRLKFFVAYNQFYWLYWCEGLTLWACGLAITRGPCSEGPLSWLKALLSSFWNS